MTARADRPRLGAWTLFRTFSLIGVTGFGGVLPVARHELVERRRWLTPAEFNEILSLSQLVPGPNVIILSVAFGIRRGGPGGAAAACAGLLALPVAIALALASLYAAVSEHPLVASAMRGIAAAAAGLFAAMAWRMFAAAPKSVRALAVMLAVFGAIALLRTPLVPTLALLAPVSVGLAWRRGDG
jgi:chromate transporter